MLVANNNKNKAPAKPVSVPISRPQRSLMYMAGSILGLGVAAIIALLVGDAVAPDAVSHAQGIWPVVAFIPNIALPLGFVLMIVLLAITFVRRSRAAEGADK